MVELRQLEKELNVTRGSINYWIKKYGMEKLRKYNGPGAYVVCVSDSDAEILRQPKEYKYTDWVYLKTISKELKKNPWEMGKICKANGIKTEKGSTDWQTNARLMMISPEDADRLRDILAPSRTAKAQSSKSVPNAVLENRRLGYYHRLTPVWMMDAWQ